MTDSMNFGPDWIRNLSSEGSTGGGISGGAKYQLADYRYGREEMLALFDRNSKPPINLSNFKGLYSETSLLPLALLPTSEEERGWQGRPTTLTGPPRGRGGSLERGGRAPRGRGTYQYGRPSGYDGGWGNGDQPEWSPRKEYGNQRTMSLDNWRRAKANEEDDGWRNMEKYKGQQWGRSSSWRGEGESEERTGPPPERGGRTGWSERGGMPGRKSWDNEDHLPEWATENPMESGGTFDERGAFHGSDDEQADGKPPYKRDTGLHKSTSQQHIISRTQPPPLSSSKSTTSLVRVDDSSRKREVSSTEREEDVKLTHEHSMPVERNKSVPKVPEKIDKDTTVRETVTSRSPPTLEERHSVVPNGPAREMPRPDDRDFERLQEDFVLKLVVDEEVPKHMQQPQHPQQPIGNLEVGSIQPPPNLVAPPIDKWFYQDPQGHMQGPFSHLEMAEWYKAGYFSNQLKVRRPCDERFFLLGELITLCGGANPFQSAVRFPVLKNDVTEMADPDLLKFQYLSQMAAYKQAQARMLPEPWSAITLQQQELAAQRLMVQQQQVPQDLQYLQQPQAANPLMHMINQMQQANKLPGQGVADKPPQGLPGGLDPHLQLHMGNILSMQSRLPASNMVPSLPAGFTSNLSNNMQPDGLAAGMSGLQPPGGLPLGGIQTNVPVSIGGSINIQRPTSHASVDQMGSSQAEDPISSLLKQLQQQKQQSQQADSLWQQNSFPSNHSPPQWQSQNEIPMSMWDIQNSGTPSPILTPSEKLQQAIQGKSNAIKPDKPKEIKKEEPSAKELKKKKELDEKQAKKDAEEKRRQEQKKIEADRKAAEEKRKKEEERIKRELEKAKKEAEEKRMRELEEKRRLKEQRKLEEEAKKKTDEQRRMEEEKLRQELQERESRRHDEEKRLQQEQIRMAKAAPWSQPNANSGMSLTEIQKAEKERKAIDQAIQIQRMQEKEYQQQQAQPEKPLSGIQLNWANKPVETRKVKSLAEIQAEEQERLAKQVAESRLQKEKEPAPVTNNAGNIWNGQNLTWSSPPPTNSQWLPSSAGFWDDSSSRHVSNKPSSVTKSNSTSTLSTNAKQAQAPKQQQQAQKQQSKQQNSKPRKEEQGKTNHNNNNGPSTDEFTDWCFNTLSNISTNVDIPTFVTFLRDIESAFDVREYVKEYLGESNATHQFASNFLEKRRSFRPRNNAHKDDMCSPAPAITPSSQHSTEFQEVKGKNKKIKKSKMFKVDARILGFNVTSAPDRINVGDRDYGDNS
ncbi:unnamed protein product [Phaedon cochleariae]|uniref:GYF domain-containing protein n=1 Tax=Phaedon cochleariae TaxID=80249 RepID=A0A9P0DSF3_PHACE|nr:unnamed protein product [Phaedon cochleariae]